MRMERASTSSALRAFHHLPAMVYRDNPCHRSTEESLTRLLVDGPTVFHRHAVVAPYLLREGDRVVGRCALIHDENLPDAVQVAFFEALPGVSGLCAGILGEARAFRPQAARIVVGLNGHLNYGAGFLLNHFDEPPVFGLPYTPPYYADYFTALALRAMVSFRFSLREFGAWADAQPAGDIDGITVRAMDPRRLPREVEQYTHIDNASFTDTPYWSARLPEENYELFHPFRHLLKGENLLFAEREGKPLGFLLWYPDFNRLVGSGRDLGLREVLRYRLANPIDTVRFTEIAVLPGARHSRVVYAMILRMIAIIRRDGYANCEGGFIFEENRPSITMTVKYLERAFGAKMAPYRRYGMFEGAL